MLGMARSKDLLRHLDRCESKSEEIVRLIERLEDKFDKRFEALEKRDDERHAQNREDIGRMASQAREDINRIWRALIWGLVALVGALWVIAEHGGLAGLVQKL